MRSRYYLFNEKKLSLNGWRVEQNKIDTDRLLASSALPTPIFALFDRGRCKFWPVIWNLLLKKKMSAKKFVIFETFCITRRHRLGFYKFNDYVACAQRCHGWLLTCKSGGTIAGHIPAWPSSYRHGFFRSPFDLDFIVITLISCFFLLGMRPPRFFLQLVLCTKNVHACTWSMHAHADFPFFFFFFCWGVRCVSYNVHCCFVFRFFVFVFVFLEMFFHTKLTKPVP